MLSNDNNNKTKSNTKKPKPQNKERSRKAESRRERGMAWLWNGCAVAAVTSVNHGTRSKGIIPPFHEGMAPCLVQCAIRPAYCFSIAAWPSFQASSSSGTLPASVSVSYLDVALRISQAPKVYF